VFVIKFVYPIGPSSQRANDRRSKLKFWILRRRRPDVVTTYTKRYLYTGVCHSG